MTIEQEETGTKIFNHLRALWGSTIFHKARRFSMNLPSKRPRSNDLGNKIGPEPQKAKNEDS